MRAEFEIDNVVLVNAPYRKLRRWSQVLQGRAAQGRCTITEWHKVERDARCIRFEWEPEQHAWMRKFLGRFARAFKLGASRSFGPAEGVEEGS